MEQNKTLNHYISNCFTMHPSRIKIMIQIILGALKVGSVLQGKIAQGTSIQAKTASITRRIQRFFEKEFLPAEAVSKLIFKLFDWDNEIVFTLDRTNWRFGKREINFLVISAIYKHYSIPLCWILLPHKGNSDTNTRIALIEKLLLVIEPLHRIKILLADREFDGSDWFKYLDENKIPFCIRLRENRIVIDVRKGGTINLKKLFQHLSFGDYRELEQKVSGIYLRIFGTRTATGELLILAVSGDANLFDAFELYSNRWTIETMFKCFKSAGFNFEDTHQKDLERLYKLMSLLAIAYAWSVKIGELKNTIKPIKMKNNTHPEFSWFTYGFRTIQTILLKGVKLQQELLNLLADISLNKEVSPCLAKITVVY